MADPAEVGGEGASPPPNSFLVGLPDGSIRIFEEGVLTVSDVLSEYPHHDLSLSPSRSLRLPPDTLLLPWNTYYLHRRAGTRTLTLDLTNRRSPDAAAQHLPPRLRGVSCQFFLPPAEENAKGGGRSGGPASRVNERHSPSAEGGGRDLWPLHASLEPHAGRAGAGPRFYTQSFAPRHSRTWQGCDPIDLHMPLQLMPTTPGKSTTPPPRPPPWQQRSPRDGPVRPSCACCRTGPGSSGAHQHSPKHGAQGAGRGGSGKEQLNSTLEELELMEAEDGSLVEVSPGAELPLRKSISCGHGKEREVILLELQRERQKALLRRQAQQQEQHHRPQRGRRNAIMDEIMCLDPAGPQGREDFECPVPSRTQCSPPAGGATTHEWLWPPPWRAAEDGWVDFGRVINDAALLEHELDARDFKGDNRIRRVSSSGQSRAGYGQREAVLEWQNSRRNALLQELQLLEAEMAERQGLVCDTCVHEEPAAAWPVQRGPHSGHHHKVKPTQHQRHPPQQRQQEQQGQHVQRKSQGGRGVGFLSRLPFGLSKQQLGRARAKSAIKRDGGGSVEVEPCQVPKDGTSVESMEREAEVSAWRQRGRTSGHHPEPFEGDSSWNAMPVAYSCSAIRPSHQPTRIADDASSLMCGGGDYGYEGGFLRSSLNV